MIDFINNLLTSQLWFWSTVASIATAAFFVFGHRAPFVFMASIWNPVAVWALVDFRFGFELKTVFGPLTSAAAEGNNQLLLERLAVAALLLLTLGWLKRFARYSQAYLKTQMKHELREIYSRKRAFFDGRGGVGSFDLAENTPFDDEADEVRHRHGASKIEPKTGHCDSHYISRVDDLTGITPSGTSNM